MLEQNSFANLIKKVQGSNLFQYRMLTNFMCKWIMAAMILFSLNFFYYVPDFTCTQSQMKGYDSCQDFVCSTSSQEFWLSHMHSQSVRSIALDYGIVMVCSNQWISSALQSLSYLGSLIGFIVMPILADNKSRKQAEFWAWNFAILGCAILLTSINLPLVGIGSFLMGFGANSAITLHYSFIKQLVVQRLSQKMIIFLQVSFSFGVFLIALISWFISDWKYSLGFFITLPSLLLILVRNWIQQTPEFSLLKGKQNLINSLNKIAEMNNVNVLTQQDLNQQVLLCSITKQKNQLSFIDLFRYNSLLKMTLICGLVNFIIEFTYDGTILSLSKIGVNVYLDQMLIGLVQMSAAALASYIVSKVQRKIYCRVSFILIAIFTTILGILSLLQTHQQDQIDFVSILQTIVLALLRVTLNANWGVFFVFIAEMYPAEITSVSFGWVSIVGTVGASISPFIRLATAQFTLFLMAALSLLSFFLIQFLHQTKGKPIRFKIKERQDQTPMGTSLISQF